MLQLSPRQVKRLKKRCRADALEWVYHGNQEKSPANRIEEETREQVAELARGKYAGFNDRHLHEKTGEAGES